MRTVGGGVVKCHVGRPIYFLGSKDGAVVRVLVGLSQSFALGGFIVEEGGRFC